MGKKTRKDEDGPFFVLNNVHDNFQEKQCRQEGNSTLTEKSAERKETYNKLSFSFTLD